MARLPPRPASRHRRAAQAPSPAADRPDRAPSFSAATPQPTARTGANMKSALTLAFPALLSAPAFAQGSAPAGNATAGSAGTASVGGQSASTVGVGAVSNT